MVSTPWRFTFNPDGSIAVEPNSTYDGVWRRALPMIGWPTTLQEIAQRYMSVMIATGSSEHFEFEGEGAAFHATITAYDYCHREIMETHLFELMCAVPIYLIGMAVTCWPEYEAHRRLHRKGLLRGDSAIVVEAAAPSGVETPAEWLRRSGVLPPGEADLVSKHRMSRALYEARKVREFDRGFAVQASRMMFSGAIPFTYEGEVVR